MRFDNLQSSFIVDFENNIVAVNIMHDRIAGVTRISDMFSCPYRLPVLKRENNEPYQVYLKYSTCPGQAKYVIDDVLG